MPLPKREDESEGGIVGEAPPILEDTVLADKPPLTVDLQAVEDEEPATAPPEQREAGRRHKSDWRKMKESYDQQFSEMRKQNETLLRELQEMRRQPAQQPRAAEPAKDAGDARKAEVRAVRQQQQVVLNMIAHAPSEEEKNKLIEQYQDLDEKRIALVAAANAPKPQQLTPDQIAYHTLAMEFPDIYADEDLRMEADVEMRKLMKRYHKPYNIATAREALERVMRSNGLGGRKVPAPTDVERARFSGVSPRGTAGGSSSNYQPSKFQMNLARAFTAHMPDLSDQERFVHWMRATKAKESGLL